MRKAVAVYALGLAVLGQRSAVPNCASARAPAAPRRALLGPLGGSSLFLVQQRACAHARARGGQPTFTKETTAGGTRTRRDLNISAGERG